MQSLGRVFKLDRSHKIQGLVRSLGVVVEHPLLHEMAHMGQRAEQVSVEQLVAKQAVKAFDIGVLRRLTGLN
jgi:hypothetical protein